MEILAPLCPVAIDIRKKLLYEYPVIIDLFSLLRAQGEVILNLDCHFTHREGVDVSSMAEVWTLV